MVQLGEGIFQRGAAVADGGPTHLLGAVDVPQGHIVEGLEHRRVHVVGAPHREFLRLAALGPGDELVGHQNIPPVRVQGHMPDGAGHRVGIGGDLFFGEAVADLGGFYKRQKPDIRRAVFVLQGDGGDGPLIHRGDVDARPHQPPAEGQALGGVVVAADEEDLGANVRQAHQKLVQRQDRPLGGDGFVVDVPGDEDGVGVFDGGDLQDLFENVFLVLHHGKAVDQLAQMEVGKMQQFHEKVPPAGR